jgi:hypothetical protein
MRRASASRAFRSNVPLRVAIERARSRAHIARHEFVEILRELLLWKSIRLEV